ncbi:uncharacterized protein BO66DRAFT_459788 [Aspergillus aculeatinus CBS 121060]|uniref:Uncharacterized protein n=1 Tax=Aspergillus aculeatinus CBS 121060 TaxID=1448322 RepID=A0ACD1HKH3_9EURO|nr:hypothetical protein BO66DRAFT_459788 [Aspergillus aculeatinus CBS 121060]RAH74055.1 hypothetical protein BO66DRAFT_459788 [Aspergillus aculeatinus CBS 121060]
MAILAKASSLACFLIACLFFSSVIQALPVPGSNTPSGVSPMALAARSPREIPNSDEEKGLLNGLLEAIGLPSLSKLSHWKATTEPQPSHTDDSDKDSDSDNDNDDDDDDAANTPAETDSDSDSDSDPHAHAHSFIPDYYKNFKDNWTPAIDDGNSLTPTVDSIGDDIENDEDLDNINNGLLLSPPASTSNNNNSNKNEDLPKPTEDPQGFISSLKQRLEDVLKAAFDSRDELTL